ncbi:sugar phosphate isomerase/epimerase family protein [Paenibacillus sp.]|jgi:sugar phosphate isomerase/epimerase|uniref:sugar phosphate isomerase/epimerase family protein n=1 Tax=Paenibacillus sp. TaxID=58172 RepID=UPI00281E2F51|nr:sugar phosphate isomerase/epimerase family protein [Paenibacillus sp.]MDR0271607.1 sugar phosphate isomerase/epimerase [Paenibacillus sp.]
MPPFRLGVITDEISQDVEDAIRIAKQYGLHGLELRSVDGKQLHRISERRLEEIAAMILDAGLSVCALSTPVFKCNVKNKEEVAAHHGMLRRYAELAQRLDTRLLRGFSFWSDGDFGAAFPAIAEELQRTVPVLEEYDLVFALEPDPSVFATNGAKVRALVQAVASPRVLALYDPGNHLWDPDGELPFPDGYEALRGHICHIHLKDAIREHNRTEAVAIGTGQVGYEQLLARLIQDGYAGWLVVETHYRLQSTLSEEQLKRPAGYDFSAGGEAATKECLESFLHLLKQLEQKSR